MSIITHDVIIPALIPDEHLHDPSILPSKHLNGTVSVKDMETERHSSVQRTVGKAVLDTANYYEDFISLKFLMLCISVMRLLQP